MHKETQIGRSMIETIGVLAIIMAVSMAIAKLIGSMQDKFKMSRISQQIIDLKKGIGNRYVASGTYENITIAEIVDSNAAPLDMIDRSSKVLTHAYAGDVTVSGDAENYHITFNKLPYLVCTELATINWNFQGNTDLFLVKINNSIYSWPLMAQANHKKLPVSIADALTDCQATTYNTITWSFH